MRAAKFLLNVLPRPALIQLSIYLRPLIRWYYRGDNFVDPIDGFSYRQFLPYGYGKQRANALSPGTLSLERHRQMWLYLQNETDFFQKPLKVLHIAPEQDLQMRFKKLANLDYVSADLFSPIADIKADILSLPFEEASFDVILCNHVLEHIPDDLQAMRELYRVLKPGGWGIVQVPIRWQQEKTYEDFSITSPEERQRHFGQYDHVRWYGRDFVTRLMSVGFEVQPLFYSKNYSAEDRRKYALLEDELLPVITKPLTSTP